jgi:hypothetical protein
MVKDYLIVKNYKINFLFISSTGFLFIIPFSSIKSLKLYSQGSFFFKSSFDVFFIRLQKFCIFILFESNLPPIFKNVNNFFILI